MCDSERMTSRNFVKHLTLTYTTFSVIESFQVPKAILPFCGSDVLLSFTSAFLPLYHNQIYYTRL